MNDALFVSGSEGTGDGETVAEHTVRWQPARGKECREGLAFEVLHHEKVDVILGSDIVQRADIGMVEIRDGTRFPFEAAAGFDIC